MSMALAQSPYRRSLRRPSPLGEFDAINYPGLHLFSPKEVYVLRLDVRGARLLAPEDALVFVRAAGQGQNLTLSVRGLALWKAPGMTADDHMIDVVMTAHDYFSPSIFVADDAADMLAQIEKDADLARAQPKAKVGSAEFGELTGPPEAVDHWLSQPLLWDAHLSGPQDRGGPTDTYAQPAEYSIVQGRADDGKRAVPWVAHKPPLGPGPAAAATGGIAPAWWMVIAAAALAAAVMWKGSVTTSGGRARR